MQIENANHIIDGDIDWIRRGTVTGETVRSAVPAGYEAYGLLDLSEERTTEDALLAVIAPTESQELIAGWIDRGAWMPESGDEHVLYTGWRYRLRRILPKELRGIPSEGEKGFPDLLFPLDRSWFISVLWDASWRSIGASEGLAAQLERQLDEFERISPHASVLATGRRWT